MNDKLKSKKGFNPKQRDILASFIRFKVACAISTSDSEKGPASTAI
jgi:hypothetical protein